MSASPPLRVPSEAERLAERHVGNRQLSRLRIRGLAWGGLVLFWVAILGELDAEVLTGGLTVSVLGAGAAEVILRLAYRKHARAAAAEFNREFPMGTPRDEAAAVLRQRAVGKTDSGRAARRLLDALYVPWEQPQEAAAEETAPPSIAIEIAPLGGTGKPHRGSPPRLLPLQPESLQGGEDE